MGRPSEIGLTIAVRGGQLDQVRVAGSAVPMASGQIRVPNGMERESDHR
jgi:trans-2,3-dihydro-3-hydroxyanthranilate isomerase